MRFKLRETPESPTLPTRPGQPGGGHLVYGGYGKNAWGLDNPQPSSREDASSGEKVQRLDGRGSKECQSFFGLRYSLAPPRGGPWQSTPTRGGPEPRGVRAKSTDSREGGLMPFRRAGATERRCPKMSSTRTEISCRTKG